jgi:hypothetical protein
MPSDYHFLLDPALGLKPQDVATAWREIPDCVRAAECRCEPPRDNTFGFNLADAATGALVVAAATLAKDLAVELVKRALSRADANKHPEKAAQKVVVEQVPDPQTGLPLFRVTRR